MADDTLAARAAAFFCDRHWRDGEPHEVAALEAFARQELLEAGNYAANCPLCDCPRSGVAVRLYGAECPDCREE